MSLRVWLPLNGNLNNQGLSNITATNNGATLNDSGKIGKCYSFSGSNSISINAVILPSQTPQWSFSCWFNLNDITTTSAECLFSERGGGGNANGYTIFLYPSSGQILVDDGVRWSTTPMTYTANTWYHLAVTRNASGKKLYINGQLKSQTTTVGNTTAINNNGCLIGLAQSGSSLTSGNQGWKGKLNDIRIYDHALSVKEIEEISQGLVLHYKLDNNGLGGENLALSTASKIVTATATGTDVNAVTTLDYGLLTNWSRIRGQTITISCDIELINAVNTTGVSNYRVGIEPALKFTDNTTGYYGIWIGLNSTPKTISQRYTKSVTLPDKDVQSVLQNGMYIQHLTNGSATIKNIKVELGSVATRWSPAPADLGLDTSIIYDSSGYGNNGTVTGDITSNVNTRYYNVSTKFANGQYIRVDNRPAAFLPKDAITVNLWQYATSWSNPISCTEGGGWNFENSSGIRFPVYISGVGYKVAQSSITPASTLNAWHMLTGTMDQDNIKIYYDGEEVGTVAKGSTNGIGYANNYLFIGAEAAGNTTTPASSAYAGNLSDVRIYATALTPEQIKELYNTSMSIDNNGNIHTRELVEI